MGPVEHFRCVDIAKTSDQGLVEQDDLQGCLPARQKRRKRGPVERIAKRLDPEVLEELVGVEFGAGARSHEAEPARVVVGDNRAGGAVKYHVVMRRKLWLGMVEDTRRKSLAPAS